MTSVYLPPMRDGVSASSIIVPPGYWQNVLAFLCAHFPAVGDDIWQQRLANGDVIEVGGLPLRASSLCAAGMRIYYYRALVHEVPIPFTENIIYQDDNILVVDKPHFLPVTPAGRFVQETLLVRLKKKLGFAQLSPIHRIDRETAGLVMFACRPDVRDAYQALFRLRQISKTYEAVAPTLSTTAFPLSATTFPFVHRSRLVRGEQFFRTEEVAGEANSETWIDRAEARGDFTLYRLMPVTGRKHQLRVNMATLGAPIVNDRLYPTALPVQDDDFSRPLQLLAKSLRFVDPLSGELRFFQSELHL